jgi:NAD(P)-dependent dehydrogenase (short-subunit alcohol dehydrogenase family)
VIQKVAKGTPRGKVCGPEDVANVVVPLLLSATLMTGQILVVDGGMVI